MKFTFLEFFKLIQLVAWVVFLISIANCSAKGPVFPNAPKGKAAPIAGYYIFPLKIKFFNASPHGEVFLERNKGRGKKTYFTMRSFGLRKDGVIRMRSYEGLAYQINERTIEFRSDRCYLYGKDDWEGRLTLMQKWDCDHLFFAYQSPSKFNKRELLKPLQTNRTKYSDWFSPTPLTPIPHKTKGISLTRPAYFAGQIISLEESPKTGIIVVWGNSGGLLLRDGQLLTAQNSSGKKLGKVKVLSRPGDFIVCRWIGRYQPKATVAYALKPAYVKKGFF